MGANEEKTSKATRRRIRTKRGFRAYTYLGCPLTKDRSAWCFRLCVPDPNGKGRCGRIAPHGLKGRTQLAIEGHKRRRQSAHWTQLERMYLAAPLNDLYDPGVRVQHGEAEIVVPLSDALRLPSGEVAESVHVKLMHDAARLAVDTVVETHAAVTVAFTVRLTRHRPMGRLIARALVITDADGQYQTECVLADATGLEIGRGEGTFEPDHRAAGRRQGPNPTVSLRP
jgi:acyl-coenzyme A thioesterase PaaI-like protein